MKDPIIYPYFKSTSWNEAWSSDLFRKKAIGAVILFIVIVLALPYFFSMIEARNGLVLNDWLLKKLPAQDFSMTIFLLVWSTSILIIVRSIQDPTIFLRTIYLLLIITLTRMVTISLVPLDAPIGLIHLKDPLTSLTYGGIHVFISKDLFFSGHTSNLFIFYLCLQKKKDKQFALLATVIVGLLLLIQHVHYSIDVVAAFIFTYYMAKMIKPLSFFNI